MDFEFDPNKSAANKAKHGIDFVQAQRLWDGELAKSPVIEIGGELRQKVIGQIEGKVWTAIITQREGKTRIISCRRARRDEVQLYDEGKVES